MDLTSKFNVYVNVYWQIHELYEVSISILKQAKQNCCWWYIFYL